MRLIYLVFLDSGQCWLVFALELIYLMEEKKIIGFELVSLNRHLNGFWWLILMECGAYPSLLEFFGLVQTLGLCKHSEFHFPSCNSRVKDCIGRRIWSC